MIGWLCVFVLFMLNLRLASEWLSDRFVFQKNVEIEENSDYMVISMVAEFSNISVVVVLCNMDSIIVDTW